jgi:pimeloyl-ACP methyl ester carboxylesterase
VELASGLHLSIVDRGPVDDPAPFLLVHGLASNKHLWDGVANELASVGRRSISVDLRGHGRSDKPDSGYDYVSITADLTGLLDALKIPTVHIVGQSWGGNVVVEFGIGASNRTESVACVDGGFIELSSAFGTWEECEAALTPPKLIGTPFAQIEQWSRSAHTDWPESGIVGALACFELRSDGTIAPWLTLDRHLQIVRQLFDHRPTQRFPMLFAPTMLIPAGAKANWAGDKEAVVANAVALLPHGSAQWFVDADHDLHAQHPRQLAQVLLSHASFPIPTPSNRLSS